MCDHFNLGDQAVMIARKQFYRIVVSPVHPWWARVYLTDGFLSLTSEARHAMTTAEHEAKRLGHNYIGTEHVLLGLLHDGAGAATSTLSSLRISGESIRQQVEEIVGCGHGPVPNEQQIPLTPRALRSLQLSRPEALRLGDHHLGTEHVLLGLIAEGDGVAGQVLIRAGANRSQVRRKLSSWPSGQRLRLGYSQGSEHNGLN